MARLFGLILFLLLPLTASAQHGPAPACENALSALANCEADWAAGPCNYSNCPRICVNEPVGNPPRMGSGYRGWYSDMAFGGGPVFYYSCEGQCTAGETYSYPYTSDSPLQWCLSGCTISLVNAYGNPDEPGAEAVYESTGASCEPCQGPDCCAPGQDCSEDEDDEDDGDYDICNDPEADPGAQRESGCEGDDDNGAGGEGCEVDEPFCDDLTAVECQILIRTHRTHCETAFMHETLSDFKDKNEQQLSEANASLEAIKQELTGVVPAINSVGASITSAATSIVAAENATTQAVNNLNGPLVDIKEAVEDAAVKIDGIGADITDTIGNAAGEIKGSIDGAADGVVDGVADAIAGQTGTLGGKLDGIKDAIENMPGGNGGDDPGEPGDGDGYELQFPDALDPADGVTQADNDAMVLQEITIGVGDIDQSGYLGGGACPQFPAFTIGGMSWTMPADFWCDFLSIVRAIFTLAGAVVAGRILLAR